MKRIVSIQDLSCVGKCSLGIALPVLSAMGLECVPLPTALLSTHTAFDGFVSRELTDSFDPILSHWRELGLQFDAISTGYLASEAQVARVEALLDELATENTLIFVDPAMADHGSLYPGFSDGFPEEMRRLCRRADVITPNVTEACLLTGLPYRAAHGDGWLREVLEELLTLGVRTAVVTGLRTDAGHIGVAAMGRDGVLRMHTTDYLPTVYYGTGDLFAAVCAGALTLGLPTEKATALAAEHVMDTIRVTAAAPDARWYGVNFEETLPNLILRLHELLPKEETL